MNGRDGCKLGANHRDYSSRTGVTTRKGNEGHGRSAARRWPDFTWGVLRIDSHHESQPTHPIQLPGGLLDQTEGVHVFRSCLRHRRAPRAIRGATVEVRSQLWHRLGITDHWTAPRHRVRSFQPKAPPMPIRRHHRRLHTIDWRELSASIRFRRAQGRCGIDPVSWTVSGLVRVGSS